MQGTRLKEVRNKFNLKQEDLANKLGYKWHKIKDIETNRHKLTIEIAEQIEQIYSINAWWLLTGKGSMLEEKTISTSKHSYKIDMLSVKASAGSGVQNYEVEVIDKVIIDKVFFKTQPNPQFIKIIEVEGDSMEPTIPDGACVLIDSSKTKDVDGIYAIMLGEDLLIKRLNFMINGTIKIVSDNKKYETQIYNPNETQIHFHIIGRKIPKILY